MLFLNIDFFRFGPRFWELLGVHVGAKLASLAQQKLGGTPLGAISIEMSFKSCVLEASRLYFGGPGRRFWKVWNRFFQNFRSFVGSFFGNGHLRIKCQKCQESHEILSLNALSQRWVGGGVPPMEAFNPLDTDLLLLAPKTIFPFSTCRGMRSSKMFGSLRVTLLQ